MQGKSTASLSAHTPLSRTGTATGHALVTSPHELATRAGLDVLAQGGNAIEAAIAAGAALTVVCPHFCGLGGDAVWMIADGEGRHTSLLGIGQAARDLPRETARIATRGPGSAFTTACLVDSWAAALEYSNRHWQGSKGFASLIAPAHALASEGFTVTASQQHWLDFRAGEWQGWSGFPDLFDTRALRNKPDRFRQPALAKSFRLLAEEGPRGFYEGTLAHALVKGFERTGIPLRAEDLAATRATFAEPLRLGYYGYELLAPPAPTQGMTTLAIMGILERLGIHAAEKEGGDFYHLIVEAIKQAFLVRGAIADPTHEQDAALTQLLPVALDKATQAVDRTRALPWGHSYQHGDTVFLAVTDAQGRSVSMLQSIYFDWGSGVVVGDTGILWQNRAAAFSPDPASPNRPRPGSRPFYTLNPGIALHDGRPQLLYGTQGADGQPQTLAPLLVRMLNHEMSPAEALAAPRFLLGRTFSDGADTLKLERNVSKEVMATLLERGHAVAPIDALSPLCGQAGIVRLDGPETAMSLGAHDPRGEGVAQGLNANAQFPIFSS
ncbi:gamma-glutamyltransferase [Mesorhizobium sp. SB112]|uniref:gamma-glutamyltransferase family protein n=1 Tax=Mesorhizobium sp. SB112 TaxID=3151853 RepID=UPI003263BCC9